MYKRTSFETHIFRLSLLSSVPLLLFLLWIMFYEGISIWLIALIAFIAIVLVAYSNYQINQRVVHQFRILITLLDAMSEGDYSLRAHSGMSKDTLGELFGSVNALAERLSDQRIETKESQLLVSTVLDHIDVAILALTDDNQIRFFNPAAQRLLAIAQPGSNHVLLQQLAFAQSFASGRHQVVQLSLGGRTGRFNVHVEEFRESGVQHKLLFITDVSNLLRSEESKAWQSLVRVISHEINNSLSPIASISQTLKRVIQRQGVDADKVGDLVEGLHIISLRANGLSQFVESYKQLAKLPAPNLQKVPILPLLHKTSHLFGTHAINLLSVDDVDLDIDPVQFEQVLINLIKNALEAMENKQVPGEVSISWTVSNGSFVLSIWDQGAGINNLDNLFVPFYTTKKQGTGIGLVLCRQIIEAHRGRLSLRNREDQAGCRAVIELPCQQPLPTDSTQ